jgi:predicted RNA-binding Zn-ribbon protein involved in translation (DUF1610 family)
MVAGNYERAGSTSPDAQKFLCNCGWRTYWRYAECRRVESEDICKLSFFLIFVNVFK